MGKTDRFVPIGKPPDKEFRDYLQAIEVDNEVVWVNKDVRMPFDIKLGERCDLGLFLTPDTGQGEAKFPRELRMPLEMMYGHNRSALLGRVVFEDKQGRLYRDVNLKGGGASKGDVARFRVASLGGRHDGMPYGLCDRGYAETDREKTEYFLKKGLRTHRVLTIIALKELIGASGQKISIAEARERGILNEDEEPVIEVRAFGTQARITNSTTDVHLEDGMQMVAQELGMKKISPARYIAWFAKTLGEQIAILHSDLHAHGYLTEHNITLDCRVTDLDSVGRVNLKKINNTANFEQDLTCAITSFDYLYGEAWVRADRQNKSKIFPSAKKIHAKFFRSYIERLAPPGRELLQDGGIKRVVTKYGGSKII